MFMFMVLDWYRPTGVIEPFVKEIQELHGFAGGDVERQPLVLRARDGNVMLLRCLEFLLLGKNYCNWLWKSPK